MDFRVFLKAWKITCMFVFRVCSGLYIHVLNVSMRSSAIFCMYEYISKLVFGFLTKKEMDISFLFEKSKTCFVIVSVY